MPQRRWLGAEIPEFRRDWQPQVPPATARGTHPRRCKENAMDGFRVRQLLEIVPPQGFRCSSDAMILTNESVRAAETPSTESWLRDLSFPYLWLQVTTAGAKNYWCGPSQKDEQPFLYVGSWIYYTVHDARIKAERLAKSLPLATVQRNFRSSMPIKSVVLEYVQETDLDCPISLEAFFDRCLVPDYGDASLSGIHKERWLSLIEDTSKNKLINRDFLHRNTTDFLGWAVKKQLLRRNPLSGTSVVKPASLADSDESVRLFQVLETPTATDTTEKSLDSPPE
jgi:hypothetical protein